MYRINTVTLKLPPLRERPEDITPLARNFLRFFSMEQKKHDLRFSSVAENALSTYNWPGNIRELRNVVEAAVALCKRPVIDCSDLRIACQEKTYFHGLTFASAKEAFEKDFFRQGFCQCNGNISLLARTIDMDRKQLYKKLAQYQIGISKNKGEG